MLGKLYILDLARTFPSEAPDCTAHLPMDPGGMSIFHRMLRPELVAQFPVPLSSDALTRFGAGDPDAAAYDHDVRDATRHLVNDVARHVAAVLVQQHHMRRVFHAE